MAIECRANDIIHATLVGSAVEADVDAAAPDPFATPTTVPPATVPPTVSTGSASTTTTLAVAPAPTLFGTPATSMAAAATRSVDSSVPGPDEVSPDALNLDGRRSGSQFGFTWLRGPGDVWANTLGWAGGCAAIWLGAWIALHRRRRLVVRWAGYTIIFLVLFLPALYFCYENLARLLPENV